MGPGSYSEQRKEDQRAASVPMLARAMLAQGQASSTDSAHNDPGIRVSIIIPTLNEAENLPFVLPAIPNWVDEIILVDGHSTDGTVALARALYPHIRVVMQKGRGKGNALRTGFEVATGEIIIVLDADGSMDPSEIPAFVGTLLAGADYAKGTRFSQGGGTTDMTLLRWLGNTFFVVLVNLLFGTRYTDITYGYNATWRRHAHALALEIDGWPCEIICSIRAKRKGLRVVEVTSFEHRRIAGETKLKAFPAGWAILKEILSERFARIGTKQKPPLPLTASTVEQPQSPLGNGFF